MKFRARPACRSRVRFPANDRERVAAAFIVQARTRGVAIKYDQLVDLLNTHYPGLGRGLRGTWNRWLVRRIVLRAHAADPNVERRVRPPR